MIRYNDKFTILKLQLYILIKKNNIIIKYLINKLNYTCII